MYLMMECTAMLRPSIAPDSLLSTVLVTEAVRMELTRHREQVRGNITTKNSNTSDIKVWSGEDKNWRELR